MNNKLVCYFSASGVTKKVAERIAASVGADIFEIEPVEKYTDEDLQWTDKNSRSSREMQDLSFRPPIAKTVSGMENYDTIVLGFPIWWYTAPTIINTFIEAHDLSNKKIYVFVTSGGSNSDKSLSDLKEKYPNLNFVDARRFIGSELDNVYKFWIQ